ncbi:MAG: tol-pal system protein YbgF [Nitrospirales bacterium]
MEDISHGLQRSVQKQIAIVDKKISAVETTQKTQLEQVGFLKLERDRLQREIEKASGRLDALSTRLQGLSDTMMTTVKAIEGKLEEQDRAMRAGNEAAHKALTGRLDSEAKLLTDQITAFQRSLSEFKGALAALGEQVSQQEQRHTGFTTQFSSRADALRAKMDQDVKAAESHLGEVNRSVQSVAKSLETVSQSLLGRIEEQDRRVEEMAKSLEAAIVRINTLNQALSQALLQMQEAGLQQARRRAEPAPRPSDRVSPPPEAERQAPRGRPRPSSTPERPPAATPPIEVASAISDKDAYDRVMQRFKQGDLGAAQRGFSAFLQTYPTSRLAANAQYWVGECYYGNKEYERAIEAFELVERRYPDSDKVAAALLKKGFAYLSLNEPQKASSVLKQVIDGYPHTPEASKAKTRLAQLAHTR